MMYDIINDLREFQKLFIRIGVIIANKDHISFSISLIFHKINITRNSSTLNYPYTTQPIY